MGHIYTELHEIPIPSEAYINKKEARVFLINDDGTGKQKRTVIGKATSDTMMHPNNTFRYLYPELWKEYYETKEIKEHVLHAGMYAACLGISEHTGLYSILHDVYGPLYGNAIMDYCMYSMLTKSNTTKNYTEIMKDQVRFSDEAYSDSFFSNMFKEWMTANKNHYFRIQWARQCMKRGIKKAWICIDGSNNDTAVMDSDLAAKGKAKSRKNADIVSFIWAVNAEDGTPVTFFVNNGSTVDSKSFSLIIEFLKSADIEIAGIILDREFCSHEVISELNKLDYPYVIMLKSNTSAHKEMLNENAEKIRWRVDKLVNEHGIFSVTEEKKLFANYPEKAYTTLFYDGKNGGERSLTLINKVFRAKKSMEESIRNGKIPSVPKELSSYLKVVKDKDNHYCIECNYEEWQNSVDGKGFYSIASSKEMSASEIYDIYYLRDKSEKQFMIMKSQLGFDTTRVHNDQSIESKYTVCFIASIIRAELMNACQRIAEDTNETIARLNRINLVLMVDGVYRTVNDISHKQQAIIEELGMNTSYFKYIAEDVNCRLNNPIHSQIRRLPDESDQVLKSRKTVKKSEKPSEEKLKNLQSVLKTAKTKIH